MEIDDKRSLFPNCCAGKRKKGRKTEDLTERSQGQDGKEAEQELQHQHRGDLQHAEDFTGGYYRFLKIGEYDGVVRRHMGNLNFRLHLALLASSV